MRLCRWVVAAVLVGAAVGCSGGGKRPGSPPAQRPPSSSTVAFDVSVGGVASVDQPPPPLADEVRAKVAAVLERYLDAAVLTPLRSGERAGDLASVFTAAALARVNGPDRPALVDEGLPKAAALRAESSSARLGALVGGDKAVSVVTATIDLRLDTGGSDRVTIARNGDLVLVPDGGDWRIDGYDVRTTRDSADGAVSTTATRR